MTPERILQLSQKCANGEEVSDEELREALLALRQSRSLSANAPTKGKAVKQASVALPTISLAGLAERLKAKKEVI